MNGRNRGGPRRREGGRGRLQIARGELSGVIAGLVAQSFPSAPFVPLVAACVLFSAILGPLPVHRLPEAATRPPQ